MCTFFQIFQTLMKKSYLLQVENAIQRWLWNSKPSRINDIRYISRIEEGQNPDLPLYTEPPSLTNDISTQTCNYNSRKVDYCSVSSQTMEHIYTAKRKSKYVSAKPVEVNVQCQTDTKGPCLVERATDTCMLLNIDEVHIGLNAGTFIEKGSQTEPFVPNESFLQNITDGNGDLDRRVSDLVRSDEDLHITHNLKNHQFSTADVCKSISSTPKLISGLESVENISTLADTSKMEISLKSKAQTRYATLYKTIVHSIMEPDRRQLDQYTETNRKGNKTPRAFKMSKQSIDKSKRAIVNKRNLRRIAPDI